MLTQYKKSNIIVSEARKTEPKDNSGDISLIINEMENLKNRVLFLERENRRLRATVDSLPRRMI